MYKQKLELITEKNKYYRNVIETTKQMQLVLMNLPINADIPLEIHKKTTQFIRVEFGEITVSIYKDSLDKNSLGKKILVKEGESIIIPAGTYHYVKNTNKSNTKLYTIYSPPEHPENLKQLKQI